MELNSHIIPEARGRNVDRRHFLAWTASAALFGTTLRTSGAESNADRIVVLSFDDAVKTHRTEVAPLLKQLGFGATFFVSHRWMVDDPEHYLTW
jgi:peptidoglycan/xylan/chitin deacetylase (PgdA/CDA1 family)